MAGTLGAGASQGTNTSSITIILMIEAHSETLFSIFGADRRFMRFPARSRECRQLAQVLVAVPDTSTAEQRVEREPPN